MGTLDLAAQLVLFEQSQAMSRHRVSPSPTLHNTITHTQLPTVGLHYTGTRPTHNVVCPSGAEPEAHNSAMGWHWNTHTKLSPSVP